MAETLFNTFFLIALAVFVPWFVYGVGVEVGKGRVQRQYQRDREEKEEAKRKALESSEALRLNETFSTQMRPAPLPTEKQPIQKDRALIDQATDDIELLSALKMAATKANYSPLSFIEFGTAWANWQRHAVNQPFGPFPRQIEEAEITSETFGAWPEWVADLAPMGSKWERLHWPDGSFTIRLVTPRALVLAAVHFPVRAKQKTP